MTTTERTLRALRDLLHKAGNESCADCGAPGKRSRVGRGREGPAPFIATSLSAVILHDV